VNTRRSSGTGHRGGSVRGGDPHDRNDPVEGRARGGRSVLKKLAVAALAAGAVLAVRKRSAAKGDAGLWAEATSGPEAVSTPRS